MTITDLPVPAPSPAMVAEITRHLHERAERIARWNADIDTVARLAIDASEDGCGIAVAVDFRRSRVVAEIAEDIPAGHAVVVTIDEQRPPRLIRLDPTNLRKALR